MNDPVRPRTAGQRQTLELIQSTPLDDAGRAYLESRGLVATSPLFAGVPDSLGSRYSNRVAILGIAPDGHAYDVVFRCIIHDDCKAVGCKKYDRITGLPTRMFNTRALAAPSHRLEITEGQLDCLVLEQVGLKAVGISGANAWKNHYRRLFEGYTVRVWADDDDSGREFADKITCALTDASVVMVTQEHGGDVNAAYLLGGVDLLKRIAQREV